MQEINLKLQTPFFPSILGSFHSNSSILEPSFGSKYQNLKKLENFLEKHRFEGIKVPIFWGLSAEEVSAYLTQKAPQFFTCWEELKKIYTQNPEGFLKNIKVDDQIIEAQNLLKKAFLEEQAYWEKCFPKDVYLMVRSSGAEDGKAANAGGNLSLNYISPSELGKALGEVLASYLDKRSLSNQIRANQNPFEKLPLSVMIQELVGEPMGGEKDPQAIPISAVLFSNEPLYTQEGKFRILRISAAFGHGESVVGNQGISTDTYLVLQSRVNPKDLYIVSHISSKPERLCPAEGKLERVYNPESLIDIPTLDRKKIEQLFELGKRIEEELFAGNPADIELVIKKETIYLVQARPINRTVSSQAAYFDENASSITPIPMKVLVPGHMQAFISDNLKEILVQDTLEDAQFVEGDHKLVIVHEDEAANSHPTVNFSERAVPCFYSASMFEKQEAKAIAVCPQQGFVAQGKKEEMKLSSGYIEHPAPIQHTSLESLPSCPLNKVQVAEVNRLIRTLKAAQTTEKALIILKEIHKSEILTQFKEKVVHAQTFSVSAHQLKQLVDQTFNELEESLKKQERLQSLFYAKSLRNLLAQEENPFCVLSLNTLLEETILFETRGGSLFAKEMGLSTLLPETKEKWRQFLLTVEKEGSPEEIKKFQQLLACLGDLKPLWLTFYFASKSHLPADTLLSQLLSEITSDAIPLLSNIRNKRLDYFLKEEVTERFKILKPLEKILFLHYFSRSVDIYDKELKAIKLKQISLAEKKKEFIAKLDIYIEMMKKMGLEWVEKKQFHFPRGEMKDYIEQFEDAKKRIFNSPSLGSFFEVSPNCDVAAAKWGSGTLLTRHLPDCAEKLFSLTHQNLLAGISCLYGQNLPSIDVLPQMLVDGYKSLEKTSVFISLVGVEQKKEEITLHFNIPQHNHSSTCQLQFQEGKLFLAVQMLGPARTRWHSLQKFVELLHQLDILPCEKNHLRGMVFSVQWKISDTTELEKACEIMKCIYDFAMNSNEQTLGDYLFTNHPDILSKGEKIFDTNEIAKQFSQDRLMQGIIKSGFMNQFSETVVFLKKIISSPDFSDYSYAFYKMVLESCYSHLTRKGEGQGVCSLLEKIAQKTDSHFVQLAILFQLITWIEEGYTQQEIVGGLTNIFHFVFQQQKFTARLDLEESFTMFQGLQELIFNVISSEKIKLDSSAADPLYCLFFTVFSDPTTDSRTMEKGLEILQGFPLFYPSHSPQLIQAALTFLTKAVKGGQGIDYARSKIEGLCRFASEKITPGFSSPETLLAIQQLSRSLA